MKFVDDHQPGAGRRLVGASLNSAQYLIPALDSADALVVERSATYGPHLQSLGYSLRFLGSIAGGVMIKFLCFILPNLAPQPFSER